MSYPNFDPNQNPGYNPHMNYPPPAYSHQVLPASGLNEPLINHHDNDIKKHDRRARRKIAAIVGITGTLIEVIALYVILLYGYLFEYCYWDFGLVYTESYIENDSKYGFNGRNGIGGLVFNLYCDEGKNHYPECSQLCTIALNIYNSHEFIAGVIVFAEIVAVAHALLYTLSLFNSKPKMKRRYVVGLVVLHLLAFISAWILFFVKSEVFELRDPVYNPLNYTDEDDEPKDPEIETGGKAMIWLFVFMVAYRIALIFLSK